MTQQNLLAKTPATSQIRLLGLGRGATQSSIAMGKAGKALNDVPMVPGRLDEPLKEVAQQSWG